MKALRWLGWIVALALLVGGCALPQWRVFQKKIDPTLAQKPAAQIEAERQGARFIVQTSASVGDSPAAQLANIHAVAVPLAASLGEPAKPVTLQDQAAVIAELERGLRAEQKKTEQWRAFAQKYAGKRLEDTGINLAGPAGALAFAGVIAACIACPAFGYIVLRVLPLLWGFFTRTTTAIGEFARANPEAGEKLAQNLSAKMDAAHKALVRRKAKANRIPRAEPATA